jgi:hypothetical protein
MSEDSTQNTTNAPAADEPTAPAADAPAANTAASDVETPAGGAADHAEGVETPAEPQLRGYRVDLYQSHWARSLTEQFNIEAPDEETARKKADEILSTKNLAKDETNDWDYELVEA